MRPTFVLDACALVEVLSAQDPDRRLVARVMTGAPAAPEIIDLEFLQTLRRHVRLETMTLETADSAARLLPDVPLARSSHRSLLRRVWELRHSITAYDAAYVALAEELQIPLVTCDSKLAGSNSHKAEIELYPAS